MGARDDRTTMARPSQDTRSKREKLEAMASQSDSPHEASIAREKLRTLSPTHPMFAARRRDASKSSRCNNTYTGRVRCDESVGHGGKHFNSFFMRRWDQEAPTQGIPTGKRHYRSDTNHRLFARGGGPPPPGFHDIDPDDE